MKATILDLRYRMKDVLRAIDRGETVTVLYRGKEKARILPVTAESEPYKPSSHPFVGMWSKRKDMADVGAYVRKLRKPRFDGL